MLWAALHHCLWELFCVFSFCEHLEVYRVWAEFLPVKQESSANKPWQFFALSCINCFHPPFCSSSTFSLHELKDEIKLTFVMLLSRIFLIFRTGKIQRFGSAWVDSLCCETPGKLRKFLTWIFHFPSCSRIQESLAFAFDCVYLPSSIYSSGNSF